MKKEKLILFQKVMIVFFLVVVLLLIIFDVIIILLTNIKVKRKKESYEDININFLYPFTFKENSSRPMYSPSEGNLGFTGKLYLLCYSGKCKFNSTVSGMHTVCDEENNCFEESYNYSYPNKGLNYQCSK